MLETFNKVFLSDQSSY